MRFEQLTSLISRAFFLIAFALLALAMIERLANAFEYTIVRVVYLGGPGRLLELSVVLLMFVVALQLREVKEFLRPRRP